MLPFQLFIVLRYLKRLLESERNKVELQHSRRQCELVKSLLADVNAEKEIMYEVQLNTIWAHGDP
jgi:protein ECT2